MISRLPSAINFAQIVQKLNDPAGNKDRMSYIKAYGESTKKLSTVTHKREF